MLATAEMGEAWGRPGQRKLMYMLVHFDRSLAKMKGQG